MVNAEEVEVLLHVLKPGPPPCKIVFLHLVPVICRETPQLTVSRERIRRSTGLGIHVELGRMLPCIHAGPAHADRKVTLESDAMFSGIVSGIDELPVQVELDKGLIVSFFSVLCKD